ncbi:MAG TPA: type IV toxin-antitoxin system AbiEi family antitoxin domain-containing protein, partial [Acidimicrobiia bacterium]
MDVDHAAHDLARRQHGLVSRAQAMRLGLTASAIRHRLDSAAWELVRTSVYRIAGTPESWHQQVHAAVLAAGDFALASHLTAARLWGLAIPDGQRIEVTASLERRMRIPGVTAHRSGVFTASDCTTVAGIPTMSAARALFDMSSRFDDVTLGKALDAGLRRGVVSLSSMHRLATRLPDIAPGRSPKRVHRLLAARVPGYDPGGSDLETRVRGVLEAASLPLPVAQHVVRVDEHRFVLDFAYPERKIGIEADGFDVHRQRSTFDGDRSRQNLLVLAGWLVLRFTSNSPEPEIVDRVRRALLVDRGRQ